MRRYSSLNLRCLCAGAVVLATSGGFAAQAGAALSVDRECYVSNSPTRGTINYHGDGFVPGASLIVTLLREAGGGLVSPDGTFSNGIDAPAPTGLALTGQATLRVVDRDRPQFTASAPLRYTSFGISVRQGSSQFHRLRKRYRYSFSGWPAGATIYAHYRRGRRTLRTLRVGRVKGPCGVLVRRLRHIALRRPKNGEWRVWYTTARRFRRQAPSVVISVRFSWPGPVHFRGTDGVNPL